MALVLATIQNVTPVPQKVIWQDRYEVIQPFSTRQVNVELARIFEEQRPGMVLRYVDCMVPAPEIGEETLWLANATGNPFAPKKVYEKIIKKGEEVVTELDNPLCTPMVLQYPMSRGQIVQPAGKDPNTQESINLPKQTVRIPPFQRVLVGKSAADWLLRRDHQQARHHQGKLVPCAEPAAFEPNDTWGLNDIREYTQFIDAETFVRNHPIYGDVLGPTETELDNDAVAIQEARTKLLHVLFFRLIDPLYTRPSRKDYEIWKNLVLGKPSAAKQQPAPTSKNAPREAQI